MFIEIVLNSLLLTLKRDLTLPIFTCSKSTMETQEQCETPVQILQ